MSGAAQKQDSAAQQAEKQVRLLEVAQAELASLKPGRAVYCKRADLLLLVDNSEAQGRVEQRLSTARRELAAAQQQQQQR